MAIKSFGTCENKSSLDLLGKLAEGIYFFFTWVGCPMVAVSENFQDEIVCRIFNVRPDILEAIHKTSYSFGGHGLESYFSTEIPRTESSAIELIWQNRLEICRLLAKFSSCRLWNFSLQGGKAVNFAVRENALLMNTKQTQAQISSYNCHPTEAPPNSLTGEQFYFRLDFEGRYLGVQCPEGRENCLWIPPEQMIGKLIEECLPADLATPRRYYFTEAIKLQRMVVFCHYFQVNEKWSAFEVRIIPVGDQVVMICSRMAVNNLILLGLPKSSH